MTMQRGELDQNMLSVILSLHLVMIALVGSLAQPPLILLFLFFLIVLGFRVEYVALHCMSSPIHPQIWQPHTHRLTCPLSLIFTRHNLSTCFARARQPLFSPRPLSDRTIQDVVIISTLFCFGQKFPRSFYKFWNLKMLNQYQKQMGNPK